MARIGVPLVIRHMARVFDRGLRNRRRVKVAVIVGGRAHWVVLGVEEALVGGWVVIDNCPRIDDLHFLADQ